MRPTGSFESGVHPGEWREVTVMGNVCKLRPQRSSRTPGEMVSHTPPHFHIIYYTVYVICKNSLLKIFRLTQNDKKILHEIFY